MVHTANHLATSIIAYLITATSAMKLVTYNLRYDSKPNDITVQETLDSLPDPLTEPKYYATSKEQPWSTRRVRVVENLLNKGIVIAGFQEALVRQVHDLAELFGDEWSWIGVGRDDGFQAGEFSPLFYHKRSLTLLSNDSFWLSDTPFEPSKYPGAGSFRICTAARFTLHENGKDTNFSILNTHLDDQSDDQRKLAASLLLHRARYEAVTTGGPVLVQGDFNSEPTGSDAGAYEIITGAKSPVAINSTFAAKFAVKDDQLPDLKMLDLRAEIPRRSVSANYATFTGFVPFNETSNWARIDFVFGGSNKMWTVDRYHVDSSVSDDGVYSSDHRPVFVDITLG